LELQNWTKIWALSPKTTLGGSRAQHQRSIGLILHRTLDDNIQHEVHLWEPDSLGKAYRLARKIERKIMATTKPTTRNYKYGTIVASILSPFTRLRPKQLEEK